MASHDRKPTAGGRGSRQGRATPKGGPTQSGPASSGPTRSGPNPAPPRLPKGLDPDRPSIVGRRPSSPAFLLVVGVMWLAVGVIIFVALHTGWKLIPAIFSIGVGLFFLRGAGATVLRRDRRRSSGK
ncbi:MAG: hypothetical protein ACRDZ8_12205 [Acidimicrobiales bacterium]